MELWTSLVLGIVEGVTEFLPISSTGHMILTSRLLGLEQTEFLKSFEISIQLGAILSVVFIYWKVVLTDLETVKKILAAFFPTAVVGYVLYKFIKGYLMGGDVVAWALLVGGLILVIVEGLKIGDKNSIDDIKKITYLQAVGIGMFQSLAVIPGVSRSAATIIGGMMIGIKRQTIVEFSFLLAIPTMLAATGYDLLKSSPAFSSDQFLFLAVGFVSSFVVALGSIKFLLKYIQNNNFMIFGVYRMLVAILFLFFLR